MIDETEDQALTSDEHRPAALKLRLEICPKCAYERQSGDNAFTSPYECPKCGILYAMAMEEIRQRDKGQYLQDEAELQAIRSETTPSGDRIKNQQLGGAMFIGHERSYGWIYALIALIVIAAAIFMFF